MRVLGPYGREGAPLVPVAVTAGWIVPEALDRTAFRFPWTGPRLLVQAWSLLGWWRGADPVYQRIAAPAAGMNDQGATAAANRPLLRGRPPNGPEGCVLVPGAALVGVVGSVGLPRGFGRRDDCPWDDGVVVPTVGLSLIPGPRSRVSLLRRLSAARGFTGCGALAHCRARRMIPARVAVTAAIPSPVPTIHLIRSTFISASSIFCWSSRTLRCRMVVRAVDLSLNVRKQVAWSLGRGLKDSEPSVVLSLTLAFLTRS